MEGLPTNEQGPKMVDLFSAEMEEKLKTEGKIYSRKIESIRAAEQVIKSQTVETRLPDGTIESSVEAKEGEWIITGAKGEKFVFSQKKFDGLYDSDGKGGFVPKERKVIALPNPFGEAVKIFAPWGTPEKPAYQEGSEKCFFVASLDESSNFTNDRYIIGDEELLLSNYEPNDGKAEVHLEVNLLSNYELTMLRMKTIEQGSWPEDQPQSLTARGTLKYVMNWLNNAGKNEYATTLYGFGGGDRYEVRRDGGVRFKAHFSSPNSLRRAESINFPIDYE